MELIVGHTTHNSAWIWVRGGGRDRRLEVELHAIPSGDRQETKPVEPVRVTVDVHRDFTEVARFDSVLESNTAYRVTLHSDTAIRGVHGQLRTFPKPGATTPFQFLHGSCNLSTDRLTALGSMAAGLIGAVATRYALKLPAEEWDTHRLPRLLRFLSCPGIRWLSSKVVNAMNIAVLGFARQTRYEQPEPLLPSPFEPILKQAMPNKDPAARPAFMIHCGDQIYFDVDYPERRGEKDDYRRNYRQAWFKDAKARELLRNIPHYMILDDHEVWDGFDGDEDCKAERFRESALAVYDEYVSARQPQSPDRRYYSFEHGDTGFFVLDTRTERWAEDGKGEMISEAQMQELERWLSSKDHALKFIVSSVPFVAQLRPPGLDASGERLSDEQTDKWSGQPWKTQRERIISAIYENEVERLVFLVGDMHCTYHARMQIGLTHERLTIHELAGGPINQLLFAKQDEFYARYSGTFPYPRASEAQKKLPWTSTLEAFHGAAPSVLKVSVTRRSSDVAPVVEWEALRTYKAYDRGRTNLVAPADPHDLCGWIRFPRHPKESQ